MVTNLLFTYYRPYWVFSFLFFILQEFEHDSEDEDEDKYADDIDMPGQNFDSKRRITVRNLRIREDTAKVRDTGLSVQDYPHMLLLIMLINYVFGIIFALDISHYYPLILIAIFNNCLGERFWG